MTENDHKISNDFKDIEAVKQGEQMTLPTTENLKDVFTESSAET